VPWLAGSKPLDERFREPVRATGFVAPGASVVVLVGWPAAVPGVTNVLHVTTL